MDFMGARVQVVQQALGVQSAAGSGYGYKNFQNLPRSAGIMPEFTRTNKRGPETKLES
jgi:hypothetical protein